VAGGMYHYNREWGVGSREQGAVGAGRWPARLGIEISLPVNKGIFMTQAATLHVLGFAGSLRRGSFNRSLLVAAQERQPAGMSITIHDLSGIPLYNADQDTDELRPRAVNDFKQAIANAGALLIATPEYNYGVSGVLKNAIDWASRPGMKSVFVGKPVAIMGASKSFTGTARAHAQLKNVMLSVLANVLPYPEVLVAQADRKFDSNGTLTDDTTGEFIRKELEALAAWAPRFQRV
ncbi:MAG: NADPH-dependent FMN reductase, partial [Gemmatimonadales bacterium]